MAPPSVQVGSWERKWRRPLFRLSSGAAGRCPSWFLVPFPKALLGHRPGLLDRGQLGHLPKERLKQPERRGKAGLLAVMLLISARAHLSPGSHKAGHGDQGWTDTESGSVSRIEPGLVHASLLLLLRLCCRLFSAHPLTVIVSLEPFSLLTVYVFLCVWSHDHAFCLHRAFCFHQLSFANL